MTLKQIEVQLGLRLLTLCLQYIKIIIHYIYMKALLCSYYCTLLNIDKVNLSHFGITLEFQDFL
jgi:hypothetical protein